MGWNATTPVPASAARAHAGSRPGRSVGSPRPRKPLMWGVHEQGTARPLPRRAARPTSATTPSFDRHVPGDGLAVHQGRCHLLAATNPPSLVLSPSESNPARSLLRPSHYPARDEARLPAAAPVRRPRPVRLRRQRRARQGPRRRARHPTPTTSVPWRSTASRTRRGTRRSWLATSRSRSWVARRPEDRLLRVRRRGRGQAVRRQRPGRRADRRGAALRERGSDDVLAQIEDCLDDQ